MYIPAGAYAEIYKTDCVDINGRQVALQKTPGTNNFYATATAGGWPIILWDPVKASQFSKETQTFFYAHECAHHALGHTYKQIINAKENQADCWAIRALVSDGTFNRSHVRQVKKELAEIPGDWWEYLPGHQRAFNFDACLAGANLTAAEGKNCQYYKVTQEYFENNYVRNAKGQVVNQPIKKSRWISKEICD